MLVVGLIVISAAMIVLFNVRTTRRHRDVVTSERPSLHYSAVQIICGDCAGDGIMPRKTFMDRSGSCEQCGGTSYVLASERGLYSRRAMALHGLSVAVSETPERPHLEPVAQPRLEPVPQMKIAV